MTMKARHWKKTNRILFISGPVLGHVTRLLSVATEMQKMHLGNIEFALPEQCRFAGVIQTHGFRTHILPSGFPAAKEVGLDGFSVHLEALIKARDPDVIVVDCNLLKWCSVMRWPDTPRILITNSFLTTLGPQETVQSIIFSNNKETINTHRSQIGLSPLKSASDLYDADIVCLADPHPVVNYFGQLPSHFHSCGSCLWEPEQESTAPLPDFKSALLFSLGSTGKAPISIEFVQEMKKRTLVETAIFATSDANEVIKTGLADFAATMYPLSELLPNVTMAVTQGGAGSTYQALSFGIPVAIYPSSPNHTVLGQILQEIGLATLIDPADPLASLNNLDIKKLRKSALRFAKSSSAQNGQKEIAKIIAGRL